MDKRRRPGRYIGLALIEPIIIGVTLEYQTFYSTLFITNRQSSGLQQSMNLSCLTDAKLVVLEDQVPQHYKYEKRGT